MVSSAALAWTTIRATLICAIVKVKVLMKRNFLITFVTWELSSDDFHATSHHCGGVGMLCDKRENVNPSGWSALDSLVSALIGDLPACGRPLSDPDAPTTTPLTFSYSCFEFNLHFYIGQMRIFLLPGRPSYSNVTKSTWGRNALKHPITELSHVSILASFRDYESAHSCSCISATNMDPADHSQAGQPQFNDHYHPAASFLSHWYSTVIQRLSFFVLKIKAIQLIGLDEEANEHFSKLCEND